MEGHRHNVGVETASSIKHTPKGKIQKGQRLLKITRSAFRTSVSQKTTRNQIKPEECIKEEYRRNNYNLIIKIKQEMAK